MAKFGFGPAGKRISMTFAFMPSPPSSSAILDSRKMREVEFRFGVTRKWPQSSTAHAAVFLVRTPMFFNDWFAVASVNYPLADWTDQYEIGVWAKCDPNARVQLAACWVDDMQNLIRAEAGPPSRVADWQRLSMSVRAPPGAASLRMALAVRGGQAWFSAARLARLASLEKRLRILVNQIGYDSRLPKSAVIAANFFPAASTSLEVDLLRENGKRAWRGKTQPCAGRIYGGTNDDWGWYFWRFDFSKAETPGRYRLHVRAGDVQAESATFTIGRGVPLSETAGEAVDFFFIQRCGIEIPGWHPACHLDDAKLPDGTVIDATGGWHSAGDYNKLMYEHGDGGVAFALIEASSAAPNVFDKFDRDGDRRNLSRECKFPKPAGCAIMCSKVPDATGRNGRRPRRTPTMCAAQRMIRSFKQAMVVRLM
jgi:hypothetical protein